MFHTRLHIHALRGYLAAFPDENGFVVFEALHWAFSCSLHIHVSISPLSPTFEQSPILHFLFCPLFHALMSYSGGNQGTAEERSRAMAATDRLSRSSDQIQRSLQV